MVLHLSVYNKPDLPLLNKNNSFLESMKYNFSGVKFGWNGVENKKIKEMKMEWRRFYIPKKSKK